MLGKWLGLNDADARQAGQVAMLVLFALAVLSIYLPEGFKRWRKVIIEPPPREILIPMLANRLGWFLLVTGLLLGFYWPFWMQVSAIVLGPVLIVASKLLLVRRDANAEEVADSRAERLG
jgi:hypothetical protein